MEEQQLLHTRLKVLIDEMKIWKLRVMAYNAKSFRSVHTAIVLLNSLNLRYQSKQASVSELTFVRIVEALALTFQLSLKCWKGVTLPGLTISMFEQNTCETLTKTDNVDSETWYLLGSHLKMVILRVKAGQNKWPYSRTSNTDLLLQTPFHIPLSLKR